jgi:hypothetical protein
MFREPVAPPAAVRLLPSGDPYYLLWDADREMLVPDVARAATLWTSRVWPGAVLVAGEIVGTWRRAKAAVSVAPWRRLSTRERDRIDAEASTLPLPGVGAPVVVHWDDGTAPGSASPA